MKSKLRKIIVENRIFYWSIGGGEVGYILLKVWIPNSKTRPWITIKYRYDNFWFYFGEIVAAKTPEQKNKLNEVFQFEPITPRKVSAAILSATKQIEEIYPNDIFLNRNLLFRMDADEILMKEY